MNQVIEFLKSEAILLVAMSASITILSVLFRPLRAFLTRKRPSHVVITNPEALSAVSSPAQPTITLTLEQFEDRLARREAEIRSELGQAQPTNHMVLKNELEELFRLKIDPEAAFKERNQRIRNLGVRLEQESDALEAGALQAAQTALAAGDPTLADGLFSDIVDKAGGAVRAAARALFARGEIAEGALRWADAARHYTRAAELDPTLETYMKAHEFAWRSGDYPTAARLGGTLAALARDQSDKKALAAALNAHATTLNLTGHYQEAESLYREILELDRATIGTSTEEYARHVSNLAHVFLATDRLDDAERLFREALEAAEGAVGTAHPFYAQRLNNLGEVLRAKGQYDEAEALYRQAIEIDQETVGRLHPSHSTHLNNLAETLMAVGRDDEAEALLTQAKEIKAATLGENHPYYAIVLDNLGTLFARQGRSDEARACLETAAKTRRAILGDIHKDTVRTQEKLANLGAGA